MIDHTHLGMNSSCKPKHSVSLLKGCCSGVTLGDMQREFDKEIPRHSTVARFVFLTSSTTHLPGDDSKHRWGVQDRLSGAVEDSSLRDLRDEEKYHLVSICQDEAAREGR